MATASAAAKPQFSGTSNNIFPKSLMVKQIQPLCNWLAPKQPAGKIAGGRGDLKAGESGPLNGRDKTVVLCKTVTGEVCGGFMWPAWKLGVWIKDPTCSSFLFALANKAVAVPARFNFEGPPDANMGLLRDPKSNMSCGPDDYGFGFSAASEYALSLDAHGVWAGGRGWWAGAPTCFDGNTLVGEGPAGASQIQEWEVWKL
jgi:hypothetical protein